MLCGCAPGQPEIKTNLEQDAGRWKTPSLALPLFTSALKHRVTSAPFTAQTSRAPVPP